MHFTAVAAVLFAALASQVIANPAADRDAAMQKPAPINVPSLGSSNQNVC